MNPALALSHPLERVRTLLVLGRMSNLPTVWSNCLAGWLLAGGGDPWRVLLLCLGASLIYVAGMFLNDAFDVGWDALHRPERPIPSGKIAIRTVWMAGWAGLGVGTLVLSLLGPATALLALLLSGAVVAYDATHKKTALSPLLMAACRMLLYFAAGSAGRYGLIGEAIWGGLVLAVYIIGLSYIARREASLGALQYWPAYLLATPLLLAWFVNGPGHRALALFVGGLLALWIVHAVRYTYFMKPPQVGRTVSLLLAGIVLVDWLAFLGPPEIAAVFLGLFGLTLLFQRYIPAT